MKARPEHDRGWLLATARAVAIELKLRSGGTLLRIRMPTRATRTNTDGWSVTLGDLGKGEPRLQVWLDRFSGYPQRKFWACFASYRDRRAVMALSRRVSKTLWPVRVITKEDTTGDRIVVLSERLSRSLFNSPVLEKYDEGLTFYGVYDQTRETTARVSPHFCTRAAAFFEDVARALPNAGTEDEQREVYPRFENRKQVASHLQRERSKLLAAECKIRDGYECKVCDLRFEDAYGKLGNEFAEAHHLIPLARLREGIRTRIEDLTTVCANCHRMLHRMEGKREDVKNLKAIVRNHRR